MKPLILYIVTMLLALSTSAQTKDSIDCTVFTVDYDYTVKYKINGIAVPKYAKTRTHYQPLELK